MSEEPRKILSNISTVSGSKAHKAQEKALSDPKVKAEQLELARKITREEFEKVFPSIKRQEDVRKEKGMISKEEQEALERQRVEELRRMRLVNTMQMIATPSNRSLYTMTQERALYTNKMLADIITEMQLAQSKREGTVIKVSQVLRENLVASLFGCDVHIGVCTDANAEAIEFLGESDYTRREKRGLSSTFECLEQEDLVVSAILRPRTRQSTGREIVTPGGTNMRSSYAKDVEDIEEENAGSGSGSKGKGKSAITSGEAVVHVPLLGKRGGVGVIEIHGLFADQITDPVRYDRKTAVLQAMMNKQDFRFIHSLRLWRRPEDRIKNDRNITEADWPRFNRSDYNLVCGRIKEVVHSKNGVPFTSGAHYAVAWEDGLFEESVSPNEMVKLYAKTPHSLGNTTMLDLQLTDSLLQLGLAAGEVLEKQRTKDALNLLRKKLYYPSLGEAETFERTLDICLGVIRGIRECSIVVWDEHDNDAVLLCTREIPTIYDRNLEFSFTEVTQDSIDSVTPFSPIIKVEQSKITEWVSVELKVPTGYVSHNNPLRRRLFANFVRSRALEASAAAAEVSIFLEVIACLSECMDIEWQREQRNKHRKELIKQIEGRLFSWRSLSVQDICHNTTQIAATVLPGADVYSGVLVNNANSVQFLAATPNSGMVDKMLNRPAGVSFDVIENLETVVLQPGDDNKGRYLKEDTTVQVYYGRKAFKGRITKDRGHGKYDVCYLDLKDSPIEAGVDIKRIVPMHTAFKVKTLGNKLNIPFICVPLRHRNKGIGVLGIDGIGAVPRAPYETQPESGMKRFLEQLGRILGTTIDLQKKKLSMKNLTLVTGNFNSGIDEVLEAAFETISENMQFVESIFCARVLYESRILVGGRTGINVVRRWGVENTDAEKRVATFNIKRSNQKPVQMHGERNVWLLLKLHGMNRFVKGKIYVVSITQKVLPISDPDLDFLNVLQKVLKNSLQSIDLKTASGDSKSTALLDIKKMVSMWDKVNRDLLFNTVADRINQCYLSANIYLGRLTAHGKELNFILASQRSNMKGKRLPRDKKNVPISIQAIDDMNRTVVTPSMDKANNLVHFGPPEGFEYPYVAIPLLAHIDSPVGVLCGDACEDPSADAEDTGDVLSFFGAVGMHLSEAVRGYSAYDAMEALNKIALEYSTVRQGMREIKRVVLGVLPYATRVSEVCYEPRETHYLVTNDLGELEDTKSKTSTDFVLLVRVLKAKSTAANVSSPVLIMNWMGQQIYKCSIKRRMDTKPLKLRIHRGTFNSKVQLQLTLQGTIDGTRKDISKKTLTMQYLSNVPTYPIEHVLDSVQDANVHVGGAQIVTKIFAANQIVEMCILSMTIRGLAKADESGLSDPFVIVKWNGDEIGKTNVIQDNLDPVWKDLKFELRIGSSNPFDCSLLLEVWDQDLIGRGNFLGCVILEGEDLVSLFTSNSNVVLGDMKEDSLTQDMWIPLVNHPKMAAETQTLVQGRMKMTGTVIVAGELTEAQINHELDIMGQMDVAGGMEGDGMDEQEGEGYHECELRVLSARDLSVSESRVVPSSFAIVRFNNEELGRTAVLDGTENPEWEDETFTIRAPGGDRLEECNLSVEIYHVGGGGKGEFIGQVILTGKELVSLIAATGFKSRWIDIIEPGNVISGGGRGQIQLGGRPSSVDADGIIPKAPEKGILEIGVLSSRGVSPWTLANYDSAMSAGCDKRKFYFQVKFNDKMIHRSVAVGLTVPTQNTKGTGNKDETFVESKMSSFLDESSEGNKSSLSSVDDGAIYPLLWSKGQANAARLRYPNKRALSDCELEVEIWSSEVIDNKELTVDDSEQEGADKETNEDENVEKVEEKAVAKLVLKGKELDSLLGKQGFKTRWVPLQVKSSEYGLFACELKLRCGPEASEDYYDLDGREIWLDIMGTSDIPRRSAHVFSEIFLHNIDKYNTYFHNQCSPMVVVKWNGKIIGETVTVRNNVDAIWSNMRFVIRPPIIDDVRESLYMCQLALEIYDTGPGHVDTNKYAESHHTRNEDDEHIRVLIGTVVLKGHPLVDFMTGNERENVKWFSITGPDPLSQASKYYNISDEKTHSFGQLRVRAALAGTTSELPSPELRRDCLICILRASNLAKPDAFSESNPYVVVDLNGRELYRTDEVRDNSNPEFNNHLVFHMDALRNQFFTTDSSSSVEGTEESKEIDTKKKSEDELIRLGMMGQIDRLTISVMNHNVIPHQMDEFLGSRVWLGHQIEEFLREDVSDLTLELKESVELLPEENEYVQGSISLGIRSLPSAPDQVISQRDAVVHIKSVTDIANTRAMGSGSDVHMKVFRRFRSEGNHEEQIYTTKIISSTLSPVFTDELVRISVPTSEDEDIWSGLVVRFELWDIATLDFLGCVVLKGEELHELVNHNDKSAFAKKEFPLVDLPIQKNSNSKSLIVGDDALSLIKGVLTVTGGYKSYFDANYVSERVAEPEVAVEEEEVEEVEVIDESGEEIEVHILRATDLPKADGFMGKSDPYCIVRWNGKEVGRTSVIYRELNPEWDEEKFKVSLAAMPESTEEEGGELSDAPEISLKSLLDIDIWDMDTMGSGDFLGTVQITGSALAHLLSPEAGEVEYPLSPSSLLTPRGNKLATKGTITLKAALVNQQRADEIRAKKAREAKQREIEKNPGLQASRIELHIQTASELAKVNMRGGANAYVKVYWLDNVEKSRSDDKTPPDAVSQVVNNNLNPEFDNEILYFEKTAGMKVSECNMRLCVYSKGTMRDEFLGEVNLTGADVVSALPALNVHGEFETFSVTRELAVSTANKDNNKYVKGKLTFALKQIGVEADDGESHSVLPPGMKEMELTVLAGSNLPKANAFGLSDPYCVVKWGSREVGKTVTISECCNPVYEDQMFILRVPDDLGLPYHVKEAANIEAEAKAFTKLQRRLAMEGKAHDDEEVARVLALSKAAENAAPPKELFLSVDIYDWNALNSGIFLGCIELSGEELNEFAAGGRHKIQWFPLGVTRRMRKSDQTLVNDPTDADKEDPEWPRLELMLGPHNNTSGEEKNESDSVIDLQVCAARGLAKADTFGSADPYVKVFWNNQRVGTTAVISNNQTPIWDDEKYSLQIQHPWTLGECILYLEVWDSDTAGPGEFLGSLTLNGDELKSCVEESAFSPSWYELGESDVLPAAIQDLAQGEIEIRLSEAGALSKVRETGQKFEIEIIGATNLARADGMFGLSDPYAIVKWNHNEIGRTPYISKTLNPTWEESNIFSVWVSMDDDVGNNLLQIDVWDYDMIGNGKFLGCAIIEDFDLDHQFKPAILQDEDKTGTFDLKDDPRREGMAIPGNIQPKGQVEFKIRIPDDSNVTLASAMNLKWDSERDLNAGQPCFELDILSVNNLPITRVLSKSCSPKCFVYWSDDEIGSTETGSNINHSFTNEHFTLKIPHLVEMNNVSLCIEVWDMESFGRGDLLGVVHLPFRAVLRLQFGECTLNLYQKDRNQYTRGTLTFHLKIAYPFWDSMVPLPPTKIMRKIGIYSAANLPGINDETPSTKGVIMVNGVIKTKTMISVKTSSPIWQKAECIVLVDLQKPIDVVIVVYHIDLKAKKEIAIGQFVVPFELLVRPPKSFFDASLSPPAKTPPKKYKFTVAGNVKISITPDDAAMSNMRPYSSDVQRPEGALVLHDISPQFASKSKQDMLYDGEMLTEEQKLWLGTHVDFTRVETLPTRPNWIIMPIFDMGQRVGFKAVDLLGTKPGHRMALCIERPIDRTAISDPVILQDIWQAVNRCVNNLRRKEIYKVMRERAMERFAKFIQSATELEGFDGSQVDAWINDAISTCCPGVRFYTASVSPDFQSLRYNLFESNGSTRSFTVFQKQSNEWDFAGRHPPRSLVVKKSSDFANRRITSYVPFPNTGLPRFVVPLAAGDVSLGFFGVEKFDVYLGRVGDDLTDEHDLRKWFEDLGKLCGDVIYAGREKRALHEMETYTLGSTATKDGVVVEILRSCMHVLQGCKLMEVWQIDKNNHIRSLAAQQPPAAPLPGRKVVLKNMKLKIIGGRRTGGLMGLITPPPDENDEQNALDAMGVGGGGGGSAPGTVGTTGTGGLGDEGGPEGGEDAEDGDLSEFIDEGVQTVYHTFLIGLRYDGVEQLHQVKIEEQDLVVEIELDMHFVITYDRNIHVTLYHIDNRAHTLKDWYGKVAFANFKEVSMKTSLYTHKNTFANWDAEFSFEWDEESNVSVGSDVKIEDIKLFNLNIRRARDLMPCDGDTSDPFCEIYYDDTMIGKTKYVDKDLNPEFNEDFIVPFSGKKAPLIIDMFDMSMVGKGQFLGRVDIPFDLLITPPPGEFEYPLKIKSGLAARKQQKVGGMLTLAYSMEMRKVEQRIDAAEVAAQDINTLDIPQQVWPMKVPAIHLTIHSALDLAKANIFGGGSDPFVVVYLDFKKPAEDPLFKTRVIDDNLSPVWEESFNIPLGVNMTPGSTTAKDFPTIRLEVYDYNRIMKGEFLGMCEIPPAVYFQRKNGEFKLGTKKTLSRAKNKLAQGELSVSFSIQDSTSVQLTNDFKISEYGFLKGIPFVEVEIIKCRKLKVAKRMTGRTDPYVVVRWNGVDQGETMTKRNTQDPNWTNEKIMVDLSAADFVIPDMTLEVWDRDFFTGGQFLGEVIIGADELLHPENSQEEIEAPLRPKRIPGEAVDKRITGVLTYKLANFFTKQRLTFPPKDFVEVKPANNSTFNPVDMRVVRDPHEEANRMKLDKLNIKGVVRKAREETDHYHNKPFERVGLISELHHGQMMSAIERTSSTVLKTDLTDMICIPALKSTANESKEDRKVKKSDKAGDSGNQQTSDNTDGDEEPKAMYIVARYDSGKLPRRDVQYLERFQGILLRGLAQATHRKSRVQKREALDSNLLYMANNTNHLANDVIVHGIVEIESALGCKADMYMLMPDGKTFAQCNRTRGDPDINSAKANDFITYASKLCRHGLILQFFRGKITICGSDWLTVSQMAMVNLDEISEEIDEIEGHGFCFILKDSARFFVPDGAFVIPMTSVSDSLMSLLVVYDLDKLPYAAYRVKIMDDGRRRKKKSVPNVKRKEFEELFGPEDGVTSALRDAGKYLGVALLKARVGDCVKKMANFAVDPSTTLEDILRHAFRVLIVAVPTIRNIAIWGVDFNRMTKLNKGSPTEQRKNWLDQLKVFLGFSGDKSNPAAKVPAGAQSPSKNTHREFPAVVCGFFGSENPSRVMHSHIQIMHGSMKTVTRKAFGGQSETKQIRMGARRSSAITETQVARRRKLEGDSSGKVVDVDWALGIPNSLQKLIIDEAAEATKREKKEEEANKKQAVLEDSTKAAKEGENAAVVATTGSTPPHRRRAASTIDRASLQLDVLIAKSNSAGKEDKDKENTENELAVPKPRDLRAYTSKTVADTEKIDSDRMALVHAETVRCTKILEKPSFRVLTGQLLCRVGGNEESSTAFRSLFGMIDPEPESDEEEEEKGKQKDTAEGDATKTEKSNDNDSGDNDKEKEKAPGSANPVLLAQSIPDNKDAKLGASDVIMEEEEEDSSSSSSDDDVPKRSPRIAGTSNVKSNNNSPRPDPNRPKAPLPPGPAPGGKSSSRTDTTDADAKSSTSLLGLEELELPPAVADEGEIKRKRRKNRITLPNLRFYLTVGMDGIGGEYGYGICGDTLESLLGNVGKEIDNTVHRVVLEIKKANEKAKQQADHDAMQAAKRAEEDEIRARQEMEAKLEKEKLDALKAKVAAESGNSSDGSSGSNGSGSRRRGSVSGRRNSVRRSSVSNKTGGGRRSSVSNKGGRKEK